MGTGTILALDVAKRTGIASGAVGSTPYLNFVDFGGRAYDDDADVFSRAVMWFARRLRDDPPEIVALEQPVPVYNSSMLLGLRGIFMGIARSKNVTILEASVGEWRKYTLGHGNLDGKEAKRQCVRLCKQLHWELPPTSDADNRPDHNAAEAAGLWLWACAQRNPRLVQRHEPLFAAGAP